MTEAPAESPIRLGPAAANVIRSIWHQKELLVLGLVFGLALGYFALPKVLSTGSTYDATIRMSVVQAPADAIVKIPPFVGGGGGSDDVAGASPDVLKDVLIADGTLKQLHKTKGLDVPDDLTPTGLLSGLSITPLEGTPLVDLSFSDGDPELAAAVVDVYATRFAEARNKLEAQRLKRFLADVEAYLNQLDAARPPGTARPSEGAREAINAAKYRQFAGDPTTVVGQATVTTNGPPLSRNVILALGLLLGLGIGAGAGLLIETAFRKVATPADAEEASGLPIIAEVRKAGTRRAPLPVIDRPFSHGGADRTRGSSRCPCTATVHVRPGSPATPAGTSAAASWTPAGCRPASVAGASTPASGPCASPTAPMASIWTGCIPAATTPHPEHGHAVLAAATAVLTGSPGPQDGGGRSETIG